MRHVKLGMAPSRTRLLSLKSARIINLNRIKNCIQREVTVEEWEGKEKVKTKTYKRSKVNSPFDSGWEQRESAHNDRETVQAFFVSLLFRASSVRQSARSYRINSCKSVRANNVCY